MSDLWTWFLYGLATGLGFCALVAALAGVLAYFSAKRKLRETEPKPETPWFDLDGDYEACYRLSNGTIRVREIGVAGIIGETQELSVNDFKELFSDLDVYQTIDKLPIWERM